MLRNSDTGRRCAAHLVNRVAAISFQSVGELWHGAIMRGFADDKRSALERAIRRLAVLSPDEAMTRMWAELKASAQKAGLSKDTADLWIAATARRHDLPLLTADKDFLTTLDVRVIRPEDPPSDT